MLMELLASLLSNFKLMLPAHKSLLASRQANPALPAQLLTKES